MESFASALPRLVLSILDAADTEPGLEPALRDIAEIIECDGAHSLVFGAGGLIEVNAWSSDAVRPAPREYEQHWMSHDPRQGLAAQNLNRVLSDVEVIDPSAFERSALYNEHLIRSSVRYSAFTHTRISPEHTLGQAFLRSPNRDPFGRSEIEFIEALMPYMRRVLRLRHLVRSMRDEISDLRAALDRVPGAMVIVDGGGRVVCTNRAADALLAKNDGLILSAQRLASMRSEESQKLDAMIRATARCAEGVGRRIPSPGVVRIARTQGTPLGLVVAPLRPANAVRQSVHCARVLVAVHDPDAALVLDPRRLAELHGFTEVESLLAAGLARGLTLAEFADERGCSENTARTHLKRVLEKSGTRRQADLVRILLGSVGVYLASK